jgi:hypothetical protein
LVAANELSLQELVNYLQSSLIENYANWLEQNFNMIYQTFFENDSFLELQNFCTDLITKEPDKIFNSIDFSLISEKILISLIQNDNFQMSEVHIWEHILKWGHAQNPELPSDPTNFSKDDFNILKNTLQQFIPFIRFYNLSSKEFLDKVLPYKKILSKELYKDLLINHLSIHPDSKPKPRRVTGEINLKNIDSKIITYQHAELISKWIDKLNTMETDNTNKIVSYEFKLMLRGSRDGFTPNKFHELCDNQSNTVTIIKVKNSKEILGGYNPTIWEINYNYSTANSFIFSFNNNNNDINNDSIENYILSYVINEYSAIFNNPNNGPSFGSNDLILRGEDFNIYKASYCKQKSYEKPIREIEGKFFVEEYEIFQIINE